MVHGRLPGISWLGWPSLKEKRKEELETPLPLERSFYGNCHFHDNFSIIQYMRLCASCAGESALRARWFGMGVVVGGRVGETGRTQNTLLYLLGNTSHSFTDWPDIVTHRRSNRRKYLGKVKEKTRPDHF